MVTTKPIKYLLGAIKYVWLSLTQPAFAEKPVEPIKQEQSKLNVNVNADFLGLYNFRGFKYSEGPVTQITPTVTHGNISLIGFANYDNKSKKFNETDLTIDFTKEIDILLLSLGYSGLKFPNTEVNDTQEVYVMASLDQLLKPTLKAFHDFKDIKGTYLEGTLSHDFKKVPLSITTLLAYNDHFLREESGFSHVELKLSTHINLTDKITVSPSLNHSHAFDKTNLENLTYSGVSVNVNF